MSASCVSCDAPIRWAVSAKTGAAIPLDVEPRDDGNIVLNDGNLATYVPAGPAGQLTLDGVPRYVSHFATCPNAEQHRRPR